MTLKSKLESREFAIIAEMEPPKGVDVSIMVNNAVGVKDKVDVFLLPDMNDGVLRMSAFGGAMILRDKGIETVVQINCRDRNRLALQADLLAASACGVTNVLIGRGEDPNLGDHPEARAVYDVDVLELLELLQELQGGRDMGGRDLFGIPQFFVGATVDAGAKGEALERELENMKKKMDRGVQFFVTPPVFHLEGIASFLQRVDRQDTSLIPTVLLLKSVGMARYIDRHYESVDIPEVLIERIQKATNKADACVSIAAETVKRLREQGFSGANLSTLGWEDRLFQILEAAHVT